MKTTRSAAVALITCSAFVAAACSEQQLPANALDEKVASVEEDSLPIAQPEWTNGIVNWHPARTFNALFNDDSSVSFRGGGNTVAISRRLPTTSLMIIGLADSGRTISGGDQFDMLDRGQRPENATPPKPAHLLGVGSDDKAWMLDAQTGRVVNVDVGGYRRLIATLPHRGTVQSACAIRDRAILYIDSDHPGYIRVQSVVGAQRSSEMRIPDAWIDGHSMRWRDVRFEGSGAMQCTMLAPWSLATLVATDSSTNVVLPRVPATRYDATGCGSGFALLAGTKPNHAKHVVRFYAPGGDTRGTIRLQMHADRIACTQNRLIAIRAYRDSAVMTSYVLPQVMRSASLTIANQTSAPPAPDYEHWRDTINAQLKGRAIKVTR